VLPISALQLAAFAFGAAALSVACKHAATVPADPRAEVKEPELTGERLEREVRAKLFADPELAGGGSIVVIVDGRRVVLQGWVASINERTVAEDDAATVAGITAVDDRLLVRRPGDFSGSPGR
jgi:osmotically-inducible protein OsmY